MKNLVFTLAVLSMCTFFSCGNDDDDEGTANNNATPTFTPPTENAFQEMRNGFLASITKDTVFDASTGISFTSAKGVDVYIYGGCLVDENWTTVTGNVNLSYTELFDIGSMAIANKPLLGRDASGNVAPLVTGGEFNIRASQNGKALQGCNLNLNVPIGLTDAQLPENAYMSAWIIDEDSADFVWEEGKQREAFIEGGATGEGATNYYCWFPFGWTNIDWLYSLPGEKTPIYVKVPDGFTNKNCAVFAAYLDMPATLALLDVYVPAGEDAPDGAPYFTEHTGIGPIGFKMRFIFISYNEKASEVLYAFKTVTLEENKFITFTDDDLKSADLEDVIDLINNFVK